MIHTVKTLSTIYTLRRKTPFCGTVTFASRSKTLFRFVAVIFTLAANSKIGQSFSLAVLLCFRECRYHPPSWLLMWSWVASRALHPIITFLCYAVCDYSELV